MKQGALRQGEAVAILQKGSRFVFPRKSPYTVG